MFQHIIPDTQPPLFVWPGSFLGLKEWETQFTSNKIIKHYHCNMFTWLYKSLCGSMNENNMIVQDQLDKSLCGSMNEIAFL